MPGLDDLPVWERHTPSRRAMPAAVGEAGGDAPAFMPRHRAQVAYDHRGRGGEVSSLDWTWAHHERGPPIVGVDQAYDDVQKRPARCQTVVTAVISNRRMIDGLEVIVQEPKARKEERGYWAATAKDRYEQMEEARNSVLELLHHHQHRFESRQRTEIAWQIVQPLAEEGQFPQAHYAFDTGVRNLDLTRYLESRGKHGVSEVECSRHSPWYGQWRRVDVVAAELRQDHVESFRPVSGPRRHGERQQFWACTQTVRLKRDGRQRLVIVHETQDLTAVPRFLVTAARPWERGRGIETWSSRWASESFPEFGQQVTGVEAAQVRQEAAVTRHFRVSGVAPSIVQRAPAWASPSER